MSATGGKRQRGGSGCKCSPGAHERLSQPKSAGAIFIAIFMKSRHLPIAVLGTLLTACGDLHGAPGEDGPTFTCTVASITDGDTFRCAELEHDGRQIRVRLSGISARERDGSCSPNHPCPAASAEASTAALERLASGQSLACRQVGTTYRRRAAFCQRSDGTDLSCAMVASRMAERWERYWGDHRC
jgi:endonuclease YncB( thermonuclease family)